MLAAIELGLDNECTSYCTSWHGCGGDVGSDGAGVSSVVDGPVLAEVVEVGAPAVDPSAGDLAAALPDLDPLGADAELAEGSSLVSIIAALQAADDGQAVRGAGVSGRAGQPAETDTQPAETDTIDERETTGDREERPR